MDTLGYDFDYFALLASHTCGGVLLTFRRDIWRITNPILQVNSLMDKCKLLASNVD